MKVKIDDIVFWILIFAAFGVILWLLHGSPTLENGLVSIGLFLLSSQLFLWRKYFEMDKNTAVSFVRLKSDIGLLKSGVGILKNDTGMLKHDIGSLRKNMINIETKLDALGQLFKKRK